MYPLGQQNQHRKVVLVSNQKMRALNKRFLKRDQATDVLAFDLRPVLKRGTAGAFFGEVIVSADTAKINAKRYHVSIRDEIVLYLIHGILHLLGYDDHTEAESRKMRRRENMILRKLGLEPAGPGEK